MSSGAGYSINVASIITELLEKVEDLLRGCNCESSCYSCLRHYRNQYIHGILDRFAALDLLLWAKTGLKPKEKEFDKQKKMILQLVNILNDNGYLYEFGNNQIILKKNDIVQKLVVYPAMWKEPRKSGIIYISDAYIKYAKPYSLNVIQKAFNE